MVGTLRFAHPTNWPSGFNTSPSSSDRADSHARASRPFGRDSSRTDDSHARGPNHGRGRARPLPRSDL